MHEAPLVSLRDISRDFTPSQGLLGRKALVRAVRGVSLEIAAGETLGLVGESGCGKSTLGRMAVGLLPPSGGEALFQGRSLFSPGTGQTRALRRDLAGVIQMVFQDPYSSLNPRMRIGESVAEPLRCSTAWLAGARPGEPRGLLQRQAQGPSQEPAQGPAQGSAQGPVKTRAHIREQIQERTLAILAQVGLEADAARRYPHEFSGGQRQRVAIARALVTRPAFVVCDEPTSSLDASVQSQVLNLLKDLQEDMGVTYCFISHDLAVVRHMSDRVAVMYRGFLVEEAGAEALFSAPCHPYTRLLLESVPGAAAVAGSYSAPGNCPASLSGDGPKGTGADADPNASGGTPASEGCPFAPRCPEVMPCCRERVPELLPLQDRPGRRVRCRLFDN